MRRSELAPFVFTPPPTGKRAARLERVLQALRAEALPVSPPRSRARKRKPKRLLLGLAKRDLRGGELVMLGDIESAGVVVPPPSAEVWLLPLAEPGKPAVAPKGMRETLKSTGGAITVYVERLGRRRALGRVEVGAGDTTATVAERLADAINTPPKPSRLELLRACAQAREKTISQPKRPDRAVRRSASARNPPIADPRHVVLKSETARLLERDPVAQRIARGEAVRGWCEATSARYGEEDDESRHG